MPSSLISCPPARPLRVLFVDDDETARTLVARLLNHLGHSAHLAADGFEALGYFAAAREGFDVVITDAAMPRIDGEMVARAIRSVAPRQPIVMLSGFAELLFRWGKPSCADLVLRKPLTLQTLAKALEQVTPAEETLAA